MYYTRKKAKKKKKKKKKKKLFLSDSVKIRISELRKRKKTDLHDDESAAAHARAVGVDEVDDGGVRRAGLGHRPGVVLRHPVMLQTLV
jgi:hypothetical protein